MGWRRIGCIIQPDRRVSWMSRKAGPCFVELLGDEQLRVYITGRDAENVSRIGVVDLEVDGFRIRNVHPTPLFDIGETGTFDESGVSYPWFVDHGSRRYLYYVGWISGTKAGFKNATGLAISENGGEFRRYSRAPILPLTREEPFDSGSVGVIVEDGTWKMYYTAFSRRELVRDKPKSYYNIKLATSSDGINWVRPGRICIDFKDDREYSIGKPMVIRESGVYKMWYCYSDGAYKVGYAESADGITWRRLDDHRGLLPAADGWDSQMVEYAFVMDIGGQRYMFYNGNGYGETGLGVAVLEGAHA